MTLTKYNGGTKMRRKVITITTLLSMLIMFSACANLNFKLNPNKTPYDQAISFFTDAWNSYHKVWLALPEEKKADWVEKYHTKFQTAGEFLVNWSKTPGDSIMPTMWITLEDELETILIKLMINK